MIVQQGGIVIRCDVCNIEVITEQTDIDEENADLRGTGWQADGERHRCPWHRLPERGR